MTFVVTVTEFRDPQGQLVAEARSTAIETGKPAPRRKVHDGELGRPDRGCRAPRPRVRAADPHRLRALPGRVRETSTRSTTTTSSRSRRATRRPSRSACSRPGSWRRYATDWSGRATSASSACSSASRCGRVTASSAPAGGRAGRRRAHGRPRTRGHPSRWRGRDQGHRDVRRRVRWRPVRPWTRKLQVNSRRPRLRSLEAVVDAYGHRPGRALGDVGVVGRLEGDLAETVTNRSGRAGSACSPAGVGAQTVNSPTRSSRRSTTIGAVGDTIAPGAGLKPTGPRFGTRLARSGDPTCRRCRSRRRSGRRRGTGRRRRSRPARDDGRAAVRGGIASVPGPFARGAPVRPLRCTVSPEPGRRAIGVVLDESPGCRGSGHSGRYPRGNGRKHRRRPRRPRARRPLPPARVAIGSGASGRVYVADDVRLRRRVAVKVLHAALADDAGFLRRFRSEAQLAASLHHPNVMAVYDWGEDGVPFMVLELLAGGSLRGMLDAGNRLTPVAGRARRRSGRRRAGLRARPRSRPPRHQAREPPVRRARHRARRRLRARPRARRGQLDRARGCRRGHRPLRRTRAGRRRAARRPRRPLRARARARRGGHRTVPLVADTPLGTLGLRAGDAIRCRPRSVRSRRSSSARVVPTGERYPVAARCGDALADAAEALPPPGPLTLAGLGAIVDDPHPTQVVRPCGGAAAARSGRGTASRGHPPPGARTPPGCRGAVPVGAPFLLGAVIAVALSALRVRARATGSGTSTAVPQPRRSAPRRRPNRSRTTPRSRS